MMKTFMRSYRKTYKKCISGCVILCLGSVLSSCSDLVGGARLPDSILDPGAVHTEAGAMGSYQNTLLRFANAMSENGQTPNMVFSAGLMSDELTVRLYSERFATYDLDIIDSRAPTTKDGALGVFSNLHKVRGAAQEARGFLRNFAPKTSPALLGHLFAVEGMADLMLAELFCSGMPLSTVDFDGDYTVTPGFSTADVYHVALGLLDSADVYVGDSVRLKTLVQLVRGRALIGLGQFDAAKAAVQSVETSFRYTIPYTNKWVPKTTGGSVSDVLIASGEGGTGLPFGTLQDPRTTLPELTNPAASLVIATGIEARLIEAEAALSAGQGEWLRILNQLRTTCPDIQTCPTPAPLGSGGIGGLPPLTDPAPGMNYSDPIAKKARVRLLFEERAYWLFLTGRRQGDLRRLVRWYGYPQETIYPSGRWGLGRYGDRVGLSVPQSERELNPLYKGCQNYDA